MGIRNRAQRAFYRENDPPIGWGGGHAKPIGARHSRLERYLANDIWWLNVDCIPRNYP